MHSKWQKTFIIIFSLLLFAANANANLSVLEERGPTTSTAPYFASITMPHEFANGDIEVKEPQISEELKQQAANPPADINRLLYPAKSYFTQGTVAKHKLATNQNAPLVFFLIGDDDTSLSWAKKNAEFFNRINAIGFITNVDTKDRKEAIESKLNLKLNVVSLEGLEKIVGITNYPFLVYKGWILQ